MHTRTSLQFNFNINIRLIQHNVDKIISLVNAINSFQRKRELNVKSRYLHV